MPEPSQPNHDPLDQLLNSASWPAGDDDQLSRLTESWETLMQEHASPTPPGRKSADGRNRLGWILALATSLFVGCMFLWLANDSRKLPLAKPADPASTSSVPTVPGATDSAKAETKGTVAAATEHDQPENDDSINDSHNDPQLTPDDYLAALATATNKRPDPKMNRGQFQQAAESITASVGNSPLLAAALQIVAVNLDQYFASSAAKDGPRSSQRKEYLRIRRSWERWAWQMVDSKRSPNQLGSLRFAIVISTERSLPRLEPQLQQTGVAEDAALAIAIRGKTRHIDAAISRIQSNRGKRVLLTALLRQPGQRPAILYLRHLRNPEYGNIAEAIANSTDQLPTDVWLGSIANHDKMRWESALAVANVCDQRVTQGLIHLAMDPTTSRTAMVALIKSKCADAQNFIAYAEHHQQLSDSVDSARRKLRKLEKLKPETQTRDDARKM